MNSSHGLYFLPLMLSEEALHIAHVMFQKAQRAVPCGTALRLSYHPVPEALEGPVGYRIMLNRCTVRSPF
ncbi:MAG: hypothetical protein ABIY71_12020, partial [Flavobacteriales bacterium]